MVIPKKRCKNLQILGQDGVESIDFGQPGQAVGFLCNFACIGLSVVLWLKSELSLFSACIGGTFVFWLTLTVLCFHLILELPLHFRLSCIGFPIVFELSLDLQSNIKPWKWFY